MPTPVSRPTTDRSATGPPSCKPYGGASSLSWARLPTRPGGRFSSSGRRPLLRQLRPCRRSRSVARLAWITAPCRPAWPVTSAPRWPSSGSGSSRTSSSTSPSSGPCSTDQMRPAASVSAWLDAQSREASKPATQAPASPRPALDDLLGDRCQVRPDDVRLGQRGHGQGRVAAPCHQRGCAARSLGTQGVPGVRRDEA